MTFPGRGEGRAGEEVRAKAQILLFVSDVLCFLKKTSTGSLFLNESESCRPHRPRPSSAPRSSHSLELVTDRSSPQGSSAVLQNSNDRGQW